MVFIVCIRDLRSGKEVRDLGVSPPRMIMGLTSLIGGVGLSLQVRLPAKASRASGFTLDP
jgi:hypothetical protein